MTTFNYAEIRNELEQMRQTPSQNRQYSAVFDFGLFLLLYLGALALTVTALLALRLPLYTYTVFFPVPLAYLALALLRKAPLRALIISGLGVLFLAAVSLLVSRVFDTGLSSSSYQKTAVGLLTNGWNPFTQTLSAFANSTGVLPYNSTWLSTQADIQPKAPAMIGAAFAAFLGATLPTARCGISQGWRRRSASCFRCCATR